MNLWQALALIVTAYTWFDIWRLKLDDTNGRLIQHDSNTHICVRNRLVHIDLLHEQING